MLFYTVGQSRIFLIMLYAGLAVGLYSTLDSALRRLFQAGWLLKLLMDLIFGLIMAGIVLTALVYAADGELRLYALMGVLCGYLIYAGTLAPLISRATGFLAKGLRVAGQRMRGWKIVKILLK